MSCSTDLEVIAPNHATQKAPCCIPMMSSTSPVYRVSVLNQITPPPVVRIVLMPDMPKQPTGFAPPQDIPAPEQIDWAKPFKSLKNWFPPLRQVIFTPWIQTKPDEETFISTLGMMPGKIYQVKHQILDGKKKLELKQKLNFQADSLSTEFSVQPFFASEPKDRAYYYVLDNTERSDSVFVAQNEQKGKTETALLTSYGQCMLSIKSEPDKNDQFQITEFTTQKKRRIVNCTSQQVLMIDSGVTILEPEKNLKPQQVADFLIKSMNQSPLTQQLQPDQVMQLCTISGVPLRSISLQFVNNQLLQLSIQNKTKFRPLSHIQTFSFSEGIIAVAAQCETPLAEHPELFTQVEEYIQKMKIKVQATEIVMHSSVIFSLKTNGDLISIQYLIDHFPTTNSFEIIHQNKKWIFVHSVIKQLDLSAQEVMFCLPRQSTVVRLNLQKMSFDGTQLEDEAIIYEPTPKRQIATLIQQLVGENQLIPLAITRVSGRIYLLVNNLSINCVEALIFTIPKYIQHGCKDIKDVLAETEAEPDQNTDYPSVSESTKTISDVEQNEKIKLKSRLVMIKGLGVDGAIVGLLKGGYAVGVKVGTEWKIVEVIYEQVMFAAVVRAANLALIRVF